MYTSEKSKNNHARQMGKNSLVFLGISIFCVIFDRVYALFSHGVESCFMLLMFLYPLLCGSLVYFLLWKLVKNAHANPFYRVASNIYNSGIATLTVGSTINGVCEIAGATSVYINYFYFIGALFAITGMIIYVVGLVIRKK